MQEFKEFTKVLSEASAEIIRSYFRSHVAIEDKNDDSPVTIADKKSEEVMRELIMKEFPEHGIIGEEFGKHQPDAEYTWVLDPIDGTISFISGMTTFGTLIALLKNGEPVLGVINQPITSEFYFGDNESCTINGVATKLRTCDKIEDATLLSTDPLLIEEHQNFDAFWKLARRAKINRAWGDCYGYALMVGGFADIMVDPIMHLWDLAALIPIVRGAGGIITDYHGGNPIKSDSIIAASPDIHAEVVRILNDK